MRERWIGWRNRVLASPGFQRFALGFAPMRPIARRRAEALFDLVAGFTFSQTLHACTALGLFEMLRAGPLRIAAIAARCDLPPQSAERLVRAATALDLFELLPDGRVALGEAGAAMIGSPGIAAMIAHHPLFYADLADPVALLRRGGGGGALAAFWRYAADPGAGESADVSAYSALMAASQPLVAEQVLGAYRFARHRRLLDVGGGDGSFLEAVAARVPGLALGLFDLASVGERARERLGGRATIHAGDFLADPLPAGYDLVTLVRVLHDHDDAPALELLRRTHAALPPGGRLLIGEPMAGAPGARRVGDVYFGLYLLAMGSGRARTPGEIRAMLREAGFARSRLLRTALPLAASAILAENA